MKRPFFKIRLDGVRDYNIVKPSLYDFDGNARDFTPEEAALYIKTQKFNMKDGKTLMLSQFLMVMMQELDKKTQWTRSEITSLLKDTMAKRAIAT